jgi:dTDP-4-dehydrorhamnose reductase
VRVLLLGGRGQLASDIVRLWRRHELVVLGHDACDVTDLEAVRAAVRASAPDRVVSTAAYNRVDDSEASGAATALAVNVLGARNAALAAHEAGVPLLWVSTDYVFGGHTRRPYREEDPPDPVSLYGISKAAGEQAVRSACPAHFIVRTSGLYGAAGSRGKGGNFVETMLAFAAEGRPIRVVDDQTLAPTSTADLAPALERLAETTAFGTYHATSAGECTWLEFARAVFELAGLRPDLAPTSSEALGLAARRPAYSVLAGDRLRALGIGALPDWRAALAAYLADRGAGLR